MPAKPTILCITLLSLAVWTFFYVNTPDAPLGPGEMSIVVAVIGAICLGAQRILQSKKKGEKVDAKPDVSGSGGSASGS